MASRGFPRIGKWKASGDRCRVFKNEGLGEVRAEAFRDSITSFRQNRLAMLVVMSV
jgi:hypothetical protein